MHNIQRLISRLSLSAPRALRSENRYGARQFMGSRSFSNDSGFGDEDKSKDLGSSFGGIDGTEWESVSSWSTGLTQEHFNGQVDGRSQSSVLSDLQEVEDKVKELEAENRKSRAFVDGWDNRMHEVSVLLKQVREPGARGSYLKDSEKAEMYRLHKQNPEVYTIEKLAKDYRIMRQRVHAILWLKELEEEEEKKLGHPLDDSVELLLDTCPE